MTKVSQKHSTKVTEIGGKPVSILEHQRLRVVTFNMIDQLHNRCDGTARKRFNDHKARFILGEDFFVRNTDEAAEMGFVAPNGLVLLTESGYLMLVKSFNDDLAWQVQRQLVNCYFRASSLKSSRRPSVLHTFNTAMKIGERIGLESGQLAFHAAQYCKAKCGENPLELMGVKSLAAPRDEHTLTPSQIGQELGDISARRVNQELLKLGFQSFTIGGKGQRVYHLTELGKHYGRLEDTARAHTDGP
ncbi:ORF6N domain-containing protein [Sorlinia euscelidii]|uniref:KilA-N DNA-binding domain-containing protein n=1 Tax=Sorlinia euscelidii TaxID=3081148 RepID=A0ABU7U4H0_9PROT